MSVEDLVRGGGGGGWRGCEGVGGSSVKAALILKCEPAAFSSRTRLS